VTTAEDTAKAIALAGSDPEGSILTCTVLTLPTNGTLSGTAPNVTYTPNPNYFGTDGFTFKVNDGALFSTPATVSLTVTSVNDAPTVSLTGPTNGAVYTAPAMIAFSAFAADIDGSVSKVEFYNGATMLGADTTSPYTFTWSNVTAGAYTLTARAIDNTNATTTSTSVGVTVNTTNLQPTITLQPVSLTRNSGESATFSVIAMGTAPLYYQWQKNSANIAGATASSYTISSVAASDAGTYQCVVSNVVTSVTSAAATLTVSSPALGGPVFMIQ
jgi:hypothetical protein